MGAFEDDAHDQNIQEAEENQQPINQDLWKKFGRGNEVGNMLFSMYGAKQKPKVSYPNMNKTKKRPTPQ